mmetsp:Transcript_24401/g.37641  ORF Transcript_24401/g.37641 Transcript_24401/m.37641 type:complete len:393 (+) Transcript_24401:319-1497(+)
MQQLINFVLICNDPIHAIFREAIGSIANQAHGIEQVGSHYWFKHVQFKMSLSTSNSDRYVVTHYLGAYHSHGFTLSRIDLSRHDTRARFILRQRDLTKTTPGTTAEQTNIISNLIETCGSNIQCTTHFNNTIMRRQSFKFIRSCNEWQRSFICDNLCNIDIISLLRIQTGSNCSSAKSKTVQTRQGCFNTFYCVFDLLCVPTKFLSQSERCCVLTVCSTNFDDGLKFSGLFTKTNCKCLESRDRHFSCYFNTGNVHSCRKAIIRTLSHVAVIIGMHGSLRPNFTPHNLNRTITQHLIHIHIRLRSTSRLINHQREMTIQLPSNHFIRRSTEGIRNASIHLTGFLIVNRTAFLHLGHGMDDGQRHAGFQTSNGEVTDAALRLCPPQGSCGDIQ